MAPPAIKKRKTNHVPSSDDDSDDASFASFGDDNSNAMDEEESVAGAGKGATGGADSDQEEDSGSDVDSEAGSIARVVSSGPDGKVKRNLKTQTRRPQNTDAAQLSAYANGTFKSNVFKLQVDELLGQVRPKHGKREALAEAALHVLKSTIEQIPSRGPFTIVDAERDLLKQKVAVPFPEPRPPQDAKYKFAYAKPAFINVVGSFAQKNASRSKDWLEIDMTVTMPESLFDDKDYLNHRYFYKRAYYLACIAAGLKSAHKNEYSLHFRLHHDNPLKPILSVGPPIPTEGHSDATPVSRWRVNIIPCIPQKQFPVDKLRPDRNCIRSKAAADDEPHDQQSPTPFYNSSMRSDMLTTAYLQAIHAATKICPSFLDACLLGSIWLRQRGFGSSIEAGGFGNFEWTALMAACLQGGGPNHKPLFSEGYSSYQLFKATLQLLAAKDFVKQPLMIGACQVFKLNGQAPLVWDEDRSHNLLFKVAPWSYRLLRSEARSSLNALGDQLHDAFDETFVQRVHQPLYRFDWIVAISEVALATSGRTTDSFTELSDRLYEVLKDGLGDRVSQIHINRPPSSAWNLGSSAQISKGSLRVGFVVNPDNVRRTVDHGPSAESKAEAAAFRTFWGEKAELRRFKDGSIRESLVWAPPHEAGQSVLEQIVLYLLGHYFGLVTTDDVKFIGDGISKLVRGGSEKTVFDSIMAGYKQLEDDLRSLRELPLSIRQIMPADAQLRFSSTKPPPASKSAQSPVPADVTLQFEGSGRWPDDLAAIQRTKIAFLLNVSQQLQDEVDTVTTRVGLENEDEETLNQAFLDVHYESHATFRLRIYHDREATLHQRKLKDKTADPKSREIAAVGLARYKRDFVRSPAQTQAISRLCSRFPALSGAIRLTKRWFASHLLSNHIADEVIELMVVRTFTQPWPWQTPSSVQTGFLRTILWVSRWDWRAEPLVVDLSGSGELKAAEMKAITTNFDAWRKLDPGLNRVALFAASNVDHDGTTYTDGLPAKVVAGRMTALAKAACAEVAQRELDLQPSSLFSSPLQDFDFALHLVSKGSKSKGSRAVFKNLELEAVDDVDMFGFDAGRQFVQELEALYASTILFFYGNGERSVVCGLWSPLTARRNWKVNLAYSTIPVKGLVKDGEEADVQADINKTAILAEIARLGGDLMEKVEVFDHGK